MQRNSVPNACVRRMTVHIVLTITVWMAQKVAKQYQTVYTFRSCAFIAVMQHILTNCICSLCKYHLRKSYAVCKYFDFTQELTQILVNPAPGLNWGCHLWKCHKCVSLRVKSKISLGRMGHHFEGTSLPISIQNSYKGGTNPYNIQYCVKSTHEISNPCNFLS